MKSSPKLRSKGPRTDYFEALIDANTWKAMITLRPPIKTEKDVNLWRNRIYEELRHIFRGPEQGFLVKRECGKKGRLHFHVGLTFIPEQNEVERLQRNFLRRCGSKNNRGNPFHYVAAEGFDGREGLRRYLRKLWKDKVRQLRLPRGMDPNRVDRFYRFCGLTVPEKATPPTPGVESSVGPLVSFPNYSQLEFQELPLSPKESSEGGVSGTKSTINEKVAESVFPSNGLSKVARKLPRYNPGIHTTRQIESHTKRIGVPVRSQLSESELKKKACHICWHRHGRYMSYAGHVKDFKLRTTGEILRVAICDRCGFPWRPASGK